jgi:hypothetical protein
MVLPLTAHSYLLSAQLPICLFDITFEEQEDEENETKEKEIVVKYDG